MEEQPLIDTLRPAKRTHKPVLVIHGGAGVLSKDQIPPPMRDQYRERLTAALLAGHTVLRGGGEAMDAVVAAVTVMEDSPLFNAGKGAVFNKAGKNELEVSLMLSKPPSTHPDIPPSRRGISATLLTRIRNPSHLVRALYLSPKHAPHPFLSGEEVERIASEDLGISLVDPSYFYTEKRWREHRRGLGLPEEPLPDDEPSQTQTEDFDLDALPKGTVGAVALDANGCIAVLTSTGGKTNKLVGRIGDTPHMGAGFWAGEWTSKRWWSGIWKHKRRRAVGISGTGDGDYFIRENIAATVAHLMEHKGYSLRRAAKQAIRNLSKTEGTGGIICVDNKGKVALPMNSGGMFRGVITSEGKPLTAIFSDDELS